MKNILNKIGKGIIYMSLIGLSFLGYNKGEKEVFLTGFGDAPDFEDNPTKELMKHFEKKGYTVIVLNANYKGAPSKLNEMYNKLKPKKIISMGVSEIANFLDVSIVAENMMSALMPDDSGKMYLCAVIDSTCPAKMHIPEDNTKKLISYFKKENIKFNIDTTTTAFVCNSLLFSGINLSREQGVEFYFFHVPEDILKNESKLNNLERAVESIVKN